MLRVSDCVGDSIGIAIPQATEWQHFGNQIEAAMDDDGSLYQKAVGSSSTILSRPFASRKNLIPRVSLTDGTRGFPIREGRVVAGGLSSKVCGTDRISLVNRSITGRMVSSLSP